jgi:Fe-S-cluster-containing hydrogenase component 2/CRP-like cAMP-binding protein
MTAARAPGYFERLGRRVAEQESACIGCNDCLLACPLGESRAVTIAELNHAIHLPVIEQPNLVAFLAACTQCQQCVPACPADLNRAEMVVFNKLKIEDSAPDRELLLQARTITIPSGWTLDGLASELPQIEIFAGVPPRDLRRMLLKSTLRFLVPGETLCEEAQFYERLCIVLSGGLEQTMSAGGRAVRILALGPGSFFGEIGVLGGAPENFGAAALEATVVLEIPRAGVLRLMDQAPAFADRLGQLYSRRALWSYARAAFGAVGDEALHELLEGARLQVVESDQIVFRQGDAPADVFLVKSGFLRASRRSFATERTLVYFREGHVFGIFSHLRNEPSQAYSVRGASRAELIRIRGGALKDLFTRRPDVHHALFSSAWEAEQLARAADVGVLPHKQEVPDGSVFQGMSSAVLVEKGIATGREVLVVDQNRCTSCGSCIAACERRHGQGRLQLRGLQVDQYLFPTACRHCDDPACLLCNVNGIVRLPSGEIKIVEENCIGCGACAERCPYGNISLHPVHKPKRGLIFSLLDFVRGAPSREQALDALDPKLQRIAVKCDLCAGYGDYACVTACPVAAAFRVDPGEALA